MTFDEFKHVIRPLAVHFGVVKDTPTWMLYHAALMQSPAPSPQMVSAALTRAAATRQWFPSVAELRSDAEVERQALLAQHPHHPCEDCRDSRGWITTRGEDGVERAVRCPCIEQYRTTLARLGVGEHVLALPAAQEQADAR